jgi:hypothetical protein
MKFDQYTHVYPSGADTCGSAKSDEELIAEGWWCGSCRNPKPQTGSIDFQISETAPIYSPLCNAAFFGVNFIYEDFLSSLFEGNVQHDLMLGKLYGQSGALIKGWVTFRGRHPVIIRGSLKAGYEQYVNTRICETCGNRLYSAFAPHYLYPPPDQSIPILQSDVGGLLIQHEIANNLKIKRKKGFGIELLNVVKNPKDGFGILL